MRGRRLGAQPRGVRDHPPQRARPRPCAAERQPALLTDLVRETDRLLLRRLRPDDTATLRRWHADPRYTRHLGGPTDDPAHTEAAIARWTAHWDEHGFGLVAAEHRETGALVGRGGVQFHRAWPHGDPEVGWAVDPEWWGQGIATEMGAAFVAWAFDDLGFSRVVSITTEANVASRRVMAKLGFTLLAKVQDPVVPGEVWVHRLDAPLD